MTHSQRVDRAFAFRPVDRVPVVALDAGTWIVDREQTSYRELLARQDAGAEAFLRAYDEMDSDTVWAPGGAVFMLQAVGAPARWDEKGKAAECRPFLKDPAEVPEPDPDQIRERLMEAPLVQRILKCLSLLREGLGGRKPVASCGCAAFTVAARMAGTEALLVWMMDEEEGLEALFAYVAQLCIQYNALLAKHGADLVMLGDPVASADMISGEMYRQRVRSLEEEVAAAGKAPRQFLHICGNSASRLRDARGMRIDGFSLDRTDLARALEDAAGVFAVLGNIGPETLQRGDAGELRAEAGRLCRIAGRDGGFLLANGCDVIPGTPLANLRAMAEGARDAAEKPEGGGGTGA